MFARAFDTIQFHYGWTDDQVMELSIKRMRQILKTIQQREWFRQEREEELVEWQTKWIATQLANLGRTQKHASSMHRVASGIALRPRSDKPPVRSTQQALDEGWTPESPVDYEDKRFARNSFEALTAILAPGIEQRRS